MGTFEWIVCAVFEVALLLAAWRVRRLWRNDSRFFDDLPERRLQTMPTLVVGGAVTVPCFMLLGLLTEADPFLRAGIAITAFAILTLVAGLAIAIRRCGKPQGLIPPHLRDKV